MASPLFYTIILLICSNAFMTFAWYAHLKNLNHHALWIAILVSWGIAFFEYIFQVPANRIGFLSGEVSLAQLKILQEVITLSVFVPLLFCICARSYLGIFCGPEFVW